MNKLSNEEFIKKYANTYGCTLAESKTEISRVFSLLSDVLVEGNSFNIVGVGTFKVSEVAPTEVTINFGERKGERVVVPAHKKLSFAPSKQIKFAYKNYKSN